MTDIIVNMSGYGSYKISLDLHDGGEIEVWKAIFHDESSGDSEVIYFEMTDDYEVWDLIDEAIQTYRQEILLEEIQD